MIVFMYKKILLTLMTVSLTIVNAAGTKMSQTMPQLHAVSAALYDADNDVTLYAKSANDSMANASTTKIMTCIVTLENADLEELVNVSQAAAAQPKVKLGINEEKTYKLKDLIYGMMLESYNDCAYAIAEHVAGSVEEFAKMMNQKANEIGCYNTYFITPNGLDAQDDISYHHTTASDLCRIMSYCVWESGQSEKFLEITQTPEYSYTDDEKTVVFTNHNKLLTDTDCVISGKTGYTSKAGYCYVAAFEKNGRRMCFSLLGCGWPGNKNYKWEDSEKIIEFSENAEETFSFIDSEDATEIKTDEKDSKKHKDRKLKEKFTACFMKNISDFY